jgi:hypothetical protein
MGDVHWGVLLFPLFILGVIIVVISNALQWLLDLRLPKSVCTMCGHVGRPVTTTKGSFIIEILMYFLFIIPGLIYTIWRATTRYRACPACKNAAMIPASTPRGQQLIAEKDPASFLGSGLV